MAGLPGVVGAVLCRPSLPVRWTRASLQRLIGTRCYCAHPSRPRTLGFPPGPGPAAAAAAAAAAAPAPLIEVDASRYETQFDAKQARIRAQFARFDIPAKLEVFRSAASHYRMRAEFRVWHEGDRCCYVMFAGGGTKRRGRHATGTGAMGSGLPKSGDGGGHSTRRERVRVDNFTVGSELMNAAMGIVLDAVHAEPVLKQKLYQVNLHTTLSGQCMVTLVYHKECDGTWVEAALRLRGKLADAPGVQAGHLPIVIGRSRGKKTALDCDFVVEHMSAGGQELKYKQVEANFSQPNSGVCQHMLTWAHDVTRGSRGDLLELYCGSGNFCIALASNFEQGVGTELSKTAIKAAKYNLELNGITNVKVAQVTAEAFADAWQSGNAGKHKSITKEQIVMSEYEFGTVLVDPPRAGLDQATVRLVQEFDRIVYISCNPDTLRDNLETITQTHAVERFAFFDQFPYTDHIECGVYLARRGAAGVEHRAEGGAATAEDGQGVATGNPPAAA